MKMVKKREKYLNEENERRRMKRCERMCNKITNKQNHGFGLDLSKGMLISLVSSPHLSVYVKRNWILSATNKNKKYYERWETGGNSSADDYKNLSKIILSHIIRIEMFWT